MVEERFEHQLHHIQTKRRQAIGSWIVGTSYMKELDSYLAETDEIRMAIDNVNESTMIFLGQVNDDEFRVTRQKLTEIAPDSNAHIARWRMGIVGKTQKNALGNKFFAANTDFILANYYHEDVKLREKINAEIDIDGLMNHESKQFVDFYFSRTKYQLETTGQAVRLLDLINDTRKDVEYWLSQSA